MDCRFYIAAALIIYGIYSGCASVIQQQAEVKYFDKEYLSEAHAFTSRRGRRQPYLTNFTFTSRVAFDNNLTTKVVVNLNNDGEYVMHHSKFCDGLRVPWLKLFYQTLSNLTLYCPLLPGTYKFYNMELPPKNFPLPVPKGEGTLNIYAYLTRSGRSIYHLSMKVKN